MQNMRTMIILINLLSIRKHFYYKLAYYWIPKIIFCLIFLAFLPQFFFLFLPFFDAFSFSFPIVLSSQCKGLVAFSAITSAVVSVVVVASAVKLSSLCIGLVSAITSAGVSVVGVPEITSAVVSLVSVLFFYGHHSHHHHQKHFSFCCWIFYSPFLSHHWCCLCYGHNPHHHHQKLFFLFYFFFIFHTPYLPHHCFPPPHH